MAKKINDEERVLDFFANQPLPVAETVLRIVTKTVKNRAPRTEVVANKRKGGRPRKTEEQHAQPQAPAEPAA